MKSKEFEDVKNKWSVNGSSNHQLSNDFYTLSESSYSNGCQLSIDIEKVNYGTLDYNYGKGGEARGIQRTTLNLELEPRL